MLTLNINKLRSEVEEREKKKIKIFENVLEMCYKKILNTNKQYDNYSCTFIVPNVVFGLPLYNIGDCVQFIMDKLIEKGFEIYFALPTTIHISWKPEATSYNNSDHNPAYLDQNNQIEYYNTLNPEKQLIIKYNGPSRKNINNHINNTQKNNMQKNNTQKNTMQKNNNIQYRPIDEYKEYSNSIYDLNDLDIFENKVDNLF